jgi:hypothetical protein
VKLDQPPCDGSTKWNARLISGDVADEAARLKQQAGQNILKCGTGEPDRTLMQHFH